MAIKKEKIKYSMLVLLFLIIAIIIAFALVGNNVSKVAFEQTCETSLEVLKQTQPSITTLIGDVQFVSENILGNEGVIDMLRRFGHTKGGLEFDQYHLSFTFSSLFNSRDYLDSISVFNDAGILLQFGGLVEKEDMSRAEEISGMKGRGLWTAAEFQPYPAYGKKGEAVVSFYRALNDLYAMNQLGYQRISIKESAIYDRYAPMAVDNASMFLVDDNGDVVSAGNKGLIGTSLSDEPYYDRLFEKQEGYFVQGKDVYFYYNINNPNWCVVRILPQSELMGAAQAITGTLMLCMFLCIGFSILFFLLQRKAIIMEQDYKSALLNREMELKYLQGQINPHFLYNTLDTIRWMAVGSSQPKIAEQIKALSDVFRHTLNGGMSYTTVAKEVEHVNKYMIIQQNRFGDRLNYEVQAEERCMELRVPNLILQPIVENAVVHGLEDVIEDGQIRVTIYQEEEILYYEVNDNGVGFDEKEITRKMRDSQAQHEVFALKNIDDRLKLIYGEGYGLTLTSAPGEGSRITVRQKIDR